MVVNDVSAATILAAAAALVAETRAMTITLAAKTCSSMSSEDMESEAARRLW